VLREATCHRERVVSQEAEDGWDALKWCVGMAPLPIQDRIRRHTESISELPLGQPEFKSPLPNVFAESLRFEVCFLWFQCFERDRHEPQKGNASLKKGEF